MSPSLAVQEDVDSEDPAVYKQEVLEEIQHNQGLLLDRNLELFGSDFGSQESLDRKEPNHKPNQELLNNYKNTILSDNADESRMKKEVQYCDLKPRFEEDLVLESEFLNQINGDDGASIIISSSHEQLHRHKDRSEGVVKELPHRRRNRAVNQDVLDDYYRRQQEIEYEQRCREVAETDPLS